MTQSNLIIRRMLAEDIPEAARIERECFSSEAWSAEALLAETANPDAVFLAAFVGKDLAGYAGMRTVLDEGDINNVAVCAEFRRRGIASALIQRLQREGRRMGLNVLMLETRASNAAAIALYEKCGFQKVGNRKGFYTCPREDAVLMSCFLG